MQNAAHTALADTLEWLSIAASRPRTVHLRAHDIGHLLQATLPVAHAARRMSRFGGPSSHAARTGATGGESATWDSTPQDGAVSVLDASVAVARATRVARLGASAQSSSMGCTRPLSPAVYSGACRLLHTVAIHHPRAVEHVVPAVVQALQALVVVCCNERTVKDQWVSLDSTRKLVRVVEEIVKVGGCLHGQARRLPCLLRVWCLCARKGLTQPLVVLACCGCVFASAPGCLQAPCQLCLGAVHSLFVSHSAPAAAPTGAVARLHVVVPPLCFLGLLSFAPPVVGSVTHTHPLADMC